MAEVRCSNYGFSVESLSIYELINRDNDCRAYESERDSGLGVAATLFVSSLFKKDSKEFENALKNLHEISLGELKKGKKNE